MKILHSLSGGLDSALALHLSLEAGDEVVVSHVHIEDGTGRGHHETRAFEHLIEHFGNKYDFPYVESWYDIGTMKRAPFHDNAIAWASAGLAFRRTFKDVHAFASCAHRDSWNERWGTRRSQYESWRNSTLQSMAGRSIRIVEPLVKMTKQQIVESLPPEIFRLCWWCRAPQDGEPCHRCMTCIQVDEALSGVV